MDGAGANPSRSVVIFWCYGALNPAWRWRGAELWQRALEGAVAPTSPRTVFSTIDATDVDTPLPAPASFSAAVLTGSPHGVYEPAPWISRLLSYVAALAALPHPPRVLGGCFGAQLLAHALGGRVEPAPPFQLAATEMRLREGAVARLPFLAPLRGLPSVRLLESHGDAAVALPPRSVLVAGSACCAHEMFCVANAAGDVFGFAIQAHPEFTVDGEVRGIVIKRRLEIGAMGAEEVRAVEGSFALPRHEEVVLRAARLFLDGV